MNAFFSDSSCDNSDFRVPEEEHPLMNMGHRYFSFIRERVLHGIQYVMLNERLDGKVWNEFMPSRNRLKKGKSLFFAWPACCILLTIRSSVVN